jgi:hypothetical protein
MSREAVNEQGSTSRADRDVSPAPNRLFADRGLGYERTSGVARHIKSALVELEGEGKVKIERKPRQQKNTVVEGATIMFVPTML